MIVHYLRSHLDFSGSRERVYLPSKMQMGALPEQDPFGDRMSAATNSVANALGHAALEVWPDLPRDMQERLFERAVGTDERLRHHLAVYLHDHHPRTAHPPTPVAIA